MGSSFHRDGHQRNRLAEIIGDEFGDYQPAPLLRFGPPSYVVEVVAPDGDTWEVNGSERHDMATGRLALAVVLNRFRSVRIRGARDWAPLIAATNAVIRTLKRAGVSPADCSVRIVQLVAEASDSFPHGRQSVVEVAVTPSSISA